MSRSIGIWHIYYEAAQESKLDKAFIPLDNSQFPSETHEFAVFQRLLASGTTDTLSAWGALSWRFAEKTGLSGQELLRMVDQAPEADVIYMNPFPHIEALFASPWWHGEIAHPDFLEVSSAFFSAAGLDVAELHRLTPARDFSTCNYFVGGPRFWQSYLPFVEQALQRADLHMPADLRTKMHSVDADWRKLHHASTYIPFIVERLFTVFMHNAGRHLKVHKVPCPLGEANMNETLRDLRNMKDVAVLTRSTKILEMWQEKRADYFRQTSSAWWCDRYLDRMLAAPVQW